jgi:hypothetical protein
MAPRVAAARDGSAIPAAARPVGDAGAAAAGMTAA